MQKKIIIFLGLAILCLCIAWYYYTKPRQGVLHRTTAVAVSASVLYSEYQAAETAANQSYLDKIIEVTGRIENIVWAGKDAIILLGVHSTGGVSCRFSPGSALGSRNLEKGTEVVIKGRCTGFNIDVNLVDCVLQ